MMYIVICTCMLRMLAASADTCMLYIQICCTYANAYMHEHTACMQMHACTLAHVRAHICTCTRCSVLARTCTLCLRTQTCSAQANAPRLHAPSPFPDPALPPYWLKRWSLPHALTIKAWTLDLVSLSKNNSRCKHHKLTAFTNPLSPPALLLSPPGSNGVQLLQFLLFLHPQRL